MNIHFIGIGGIGVSALAKYYLTKGHKISGSDLVSSEITESLKKLGVKIFIGSHKKQNLLLPIDLLIYSPAISKENPELKEAKKIRIKCQSYPEALGELTKKYFTIAVCGTHGKSTTTAMIGLLLTKAGFDPTVILGTKLKEFSNSNCRVGKSKYLVIEADEYMASFLNYWPKIIVLTSLDPDHLDYYKNFRNYILAFKKFISHLPKNGYLIANKDDSNIYKVFSFTRKNLIWYSINDKESEHLKKFLKIPGEFNVLNSLAVLKVAEILKIPDEIFFKTISQYKGSWRRFEEKKVIIDHRSLIIISDYAHHPTEIKVTLKAAREKYPKRKILCIFQPHQYQRTYYLFKDFVKTFQKALNQKWIDKLIITDIYDVAGRENEKIKNKINSQKIVETIKQYKILSQKNIIYLADFQKIINYLNKNLRNEEIIIIMGAGDIYKLNKEIKKLKK